MGLQKTIEKPIAVYVRVSTRKQDVENQRLAIEQWLSAHGLTWDDVDYKFEDIESGAEDARPGFQELWRLVKNKQVKSIVVFEISRLSRRQRTLIDFLYDSIEAGVTIYSVKESYLGDWLSDSRSRTIIVGLLSILYDLERQLISERTKAGMARLKAEGKHLGRPRINVNKQEVLRLLNAGLSIPAIAKAVGVSESTLRKRLKEWGIE